MYSMVQAGSMGAPFVAVRGLLGSDILEHRKDLRVIDNPFQAEEPVVVAQPIRPDIAVFHVARADRFGNALTLGERRDDLMLARAARRVVVTAEQIVERKIKPVDAGTFLPAVDVDQVVHVPGGAHPAGCGGRYERDMTHIREYMEAAKEESMFNAYLKRYVFEPRDHRDYLSRVGFLPREIKG
jgi:glutaconate CoA-transferase, subunit A